MLMRARITLLAVLVAALAMPAAAVTYIVPTDREMVESTSTIVRGKATAIHYREAADGQLETVILFEVERVLKGGAAVGTTLEVVQPGGRKGTRWSAIPGAPSWRVGAETIVFLRSEGGAYALRGWGLGKFDVQTLADGRQALVRDAHDSLMLEAGGAVVKERLRDRARFEEFIVRGDSAAAKGGDYFIDLDASTQRAIESQYTADDYLAFDFGGVKARWQGPTFTMTPNGAVQNGSTAAATAEAAGSGAGAWGGGSIDISIGASNPVPAGTDDGVNSIIFNSSSATGDGGVAAFTWVYGDVGQIMQTDIHVGAGYNANNQSQFEQLMAHEFGHSLGFRHSESGDPSTSQAVMYGSINGVYGANLQCWDQEAKRTVYGGSPSCTAAPSITQQPQSQTVQSGSGVSLSVGATNGCAFTYQWFRGSSGDTSDPIAGANGATYNSGALTQGATFWVKVGNDCGFTASATATVNVTGAQCDEIDILSQPQNQTIVAGMSATLSFSHSGSAPFTYQWYRGDHSNGVAISGAVSATYNTGPLSQTTKFYAIVKNACDEEDTDEATITVTTSCTAPAIATQPQSTSIAPGTTATLSVAATGTSLQYQWFEGPSGDLGRPVSGGTSPTLTTRVLTSSTSFWVRVKNSCGELFSSAAVITVGQACTLPVITTPPASLSVGIGSSATLSVTATGTAPLTYQWYRGTHPDTTNPAGTTASITTGPITANTSFWVRVSNSCGSVDSSTAVITAVCVAPPSPSIDSPANVISGQSYDVSFDSATPVTHFEIQESTDPGFIGALTQTATNKKVTFTHTVTTATKYYYRVRGFAACNGSAGIFSATMEVVVVPSPSANDLDPNASTPFGSTKPVVFQYKLMPPAGAKQALDTPFTITTDKPWLTASPSSGNIPAGGIDVTVTASPSGLPSGTNTATLKATGGGGSTVATTPISVNLVTPVTPKPKTSPSQNAVVIPVVGHASGANGSKFLSDVRIGNRSNQNIEYLLTFTPSSTDGSTSKQSKITVRPEETKALNDIVQTWFGIGATGESALGVLEIKPLNFTGKIDTHAGELATVASSRTYNLTQNGTFGQYIPGVPVSQFIGKAPGNQPVRLSLQQIAQNEFYRTNFGLVEGAGVAAQVKISIFSATGQKLREVTQFLAPFQHIQVNRYLESLGINNLSDGRIEVEVITEGGRVTTYASVVDNNTNDPLLVFPVDPGAISTGRYTLPGVADLNNSAASWRTDVRIFNGGAGPVSATLSFQEFRRADGTLPAPVTRPVQIQAGAVAGYDNILQSLFGKTNVGGALHVTTPNNSSLVVTGRTYDLRTLDGKRATYGQFIPAVTPAEGVGVGERALQVLQVEESERFRSHLGLAEVSGSPVLVEVSVGAPDLLSSPKREVYLAANEFLQMNQILKLMNLPTTYNARLTVKAIAGTGRVTAYASVIDNKTQDPTYVPAQ
jgi:hypothetical protein